MSTILKALRRLEEEKEQQAREDRLHGEIVAPAPPPETSRLRPLLLLLVVGVLSVAVGAGAFLLLPGMFGGSGEGEPVEVAAVAAGLTPPAEPGATAKAQIDEREQAAGRREEAAKLRRKAALTALAARRAATANEAPPAASEPATAPRVSPDVAVFERPKPAAAEPVDPEPTPKQVAQVITSRPVDELPRHTPPLREDPPPAPQAKPEPKPAPEPIAKAEPRPPLQERQVKQQKKAESGLERIERQRVPDVQVVSTVWHPSAERRSARLRVDGEVIELREGDAVQGLVLTEIKLSGVTLQHDGVTISMRVGKGR
jgi:hypothetical protein